MPVYNGEYSPSFRKPEPKGSYSNMRGRFNFGRVVGDPFALASISIATLAWLIALIGSIIADIETQFPNFSWWCVAYYLCLIVGITTMISVDGVFTYHVACVGFLACGLFLTTSSVNSLIYSPNGAAEAAAAGYLLLAIITIIWIFYFGSEPEASHRRFIDSFALHKSTHPSTNPSRQMSHPTFGAQPPSHSFNDRHPQSYTSQNQLRGFETSSPIASGPSAAFGQQARDASGQFGGGYPHNFNNTISSAHESERDRLKREFLEGYPLAAQAIYGYEKNKDDITEISFKQGAWLLLSDTSGRWWQAKNCETGDVGIAPSNYLRVEPTGIPDDVLDKFLNIVDGVQQI